MTHNTFFKTGYQNIALVPIIFPQKVQWVHWELRSCYVAKCGVMNLCGGILAVSKGSRNLRPCRWVTRPEEQKTCLAVNNAQYFQHISHHKDQFLSPVVKLCTCAVLLLFEEIPVAHTGFPMHIPRGFLKGAQSPSSVSKQNSVSSMLRRHTKACSSISWRPGMKTKQHNGAV